MKFIAVLIVALTILSVSFSLKTQSTIQSKVLYDKKQINVPTLDFNDDPKFSLVKSGDEGSKLKKIFDKYSE